MRMLPQEQLFNIGCLDSCSSICFLTSESVLPPRQRACHTSKFFNATSPLFIALCWRAKSIARIANQLRYDSHVPPLPAQQQSTTRTLTAESGSKCVAIATKADEQHPTISFADQCLLKQRTRSTPLVNQAYVSIAVSPTFSHISPVVA